MKPDKRQIIKIKMDYYIPERDYEERIGDVLEKELGAPIDVVSYCLNHNPDPRDILHKWYYKNGIAVCVEEEQNQSNKIRANFKLVSDITPIDGLNGLSKKIIDLHPSLKEEKQEKVQGNSPWFG